MSKINKKQDVNIARLEERVNSLENRLGNFITNDFSHLQVDVKEIKKSLQNNIKEISKESKDERKELKKSFDEKLDSMDDSFNKKVDKIENKFDKVIKKITFGVVVFIAVEIAISLITKLVI